MKIEAVVFDLDGTLADTIPLTIYSLKEVTKEMTGKNLSDEEILKEFGPVDTKIIEKLVGDSGKESVDRYIAHFKEHFDALVKPLEGIEDLLSYLRANKIRLGVFTGRGSRAAHIILEKLKIKEYFDVIITGDMTKEPKPHPEGIFKALEALDKNPQESIYVGDFDVDVLASRAAGAHSVLALWSSTKSSDLISLEPTRFFYSPMDFVAWLKSLDKNNYVKG